MKLPTPSADNYKVGGTIIIVGGLDLGHIESFRADPAIETLDHSTARSGAKKLDRRVVISKALSFNVVLHEHTPEIYRLHLMGGGAGNNVTPLTDPLSERNVVITYLDESGDIWELSHTKCTIEPDGAIDMGDFSDWSSIPLRITLQEDASTPSTPFGTLVFS